MGDPQLSADAGNWLYKAVDAGNLEQIRSQFATLRMEELVRLSTSREEKNGELPLHCAARRGHGDILELLLSENLQQLTDAQSTAKGWSSLHFAAAYGHAKIVQWLLNFHKADVALRDYEGNTPLHLAVSYGQKDVVPYLVPEASILFTLNNNNIMPITFCKDHPSMFDALISTKSVGLVSFNAARRSITQASLHIDAENRTILHYAAQFAKDADAIAKLITDNPGNLHYRDNQGHTFLHVAAKSGNMQVLQALKKLGSARVDVTHLFSVSGCDQLHSPGMYALLHNHREFFNELITLGKVEITLSCIIKGLIGELIDNSDIQMRLALFASTLPTYLALYANKECIFNFLLDTNLLSLSQWDDEYKRTCLHWAVVDKRTDIVEKLCHNVQLRPGIQDGDGKTALHHAFEQNNHTVMEILRDKRYFKEHEEKLYRDREVYVHALNGILVGAALIASVTFAGWLQLPSGGEFDSLFMKIFWASNSISFFTAVATVCVTTTGLLPTPNKYVGDIVNWVWLAIVIDAGLLGFSLAAVTGAFAAAGFAASQQSHSFTYQAIMGTTAALGGLLCLTMWTAFMLQLYRCTPSKKYVACSSAPALPCTSCWTRWLPAPIWNMRVRIGDSSRFGYPVKLKSELKAFMNRDLVAYNASQQLALGTHAPHASSFIPMDTMKQQLRDLDIPDIDNFIKNVYEEKQGEIANGQMLQSRSLHHISFE